MKAAVAIGANLGDPTTTFERALSEIEQQIGQILLRSHWYRTKPLAVPDVAACEQPDYLNGVILIETSMSPQQLLAALLEIERLLGRNRESQSIRWGARVLDLDLLLVEDQIVDSKSLTLPHPEMHRRDFVLVPLMEVWPDWRHPRLDRGVGELISGLTENTIIERV